jgi:hypothetical protein
MTNVLPLEGITDVLALEGMTDVLETDVLALHRRVLRRIAGAMPVPFPSSKLKFCQNLVRRYF